MISIPKHLLLLLLLPASAKTADVVSSAIISDQNISIAHGDYFHGISYQNNQADHQLIKDSSGEYQIWSKENQVIGFEGVRWIDNKRHRALFVVANDGKAYLIENSTREAKNYFKEEGKDPFAIGPSRPTKNTCDSKQEPVASLNEGLTPILSGQRNNSSCGSSVIVKAFRDSIEANFPPNKSNLTGTGLFACLQEENNPLHLKLSRAKAQEVQKKVAFRQLESNPVNLICKDDARQEAEAPAMASEPDQVTIFASHPKLLKAKSSDQNPKKALTAEISALYAHEILHLAGLDQSQESLISDIVKYCQNSPEPERTFLPRPEVMIAAPNLNPNQAKKIEVYQEKTGAVAPSGMAQAGGVGRAQSLAGAQKASVQSAPEINQLVSAAPDQQRTAQMIRSGGLANAVQISRAQTAPLREYVNTAMDTFVPKAEAASARRGLASTSGSNSKSMLGKKIVGRNGKEYTVVEEYLADGGSAQAASVAPREQNPPRPSQASGTAAAAAASRSAAADSGVSDSEIAGGGMAPSAGSGVAPVGGAGGLRAAGRSAGNNNRAPASAPRGASGGGGNPDNVITETLNLFTEKQYTEIKRDLNRPDFQERLREADITILDTNGARFGAEKGKVIYLDKGNRFIRMR